MIKQLKKNIPLFITIVCFVILIIIEIVVFSNSGAENNLPETEEEQLDAAEETEDIAEDDHRSAEDAQDTAEEADDGSDDETEASEDTQDAEDDIHNAENVATEDDEEEAEEEDQDILILVNQTHDVPSDWTVDLVELDNDQSIDVRAYEDLQAMIDDAIDLGLDPLICSSYRTLEKQTELYEDKVSYFTDMGYSEEEALSLAAEYVAAPDTSEHQLGLAVDICSESYQVLETDQEDTEVQQWLMANSYRYGFILRYPEDKTEVTGVTYEPWHYRYVGVEAATEIYEQGLCLEEYLDSE